MKICGAVLPGKVPSAVLAAAGLAHLPPYIVVDNFIVVSKAQAVSRGWLEQMSFFQHRNLSGNFTSEQNVINSIGRGVESLVEQVRTGQAVLFRDFVIEPGGVIILPQPASRKNYIPRCRDCW